MRTLVMKVALLSESPADEAALRVLVEGVLRERVQFVEPALRARGWPSVAQVLPAVLRHLLPADTPLPHTEKN